MERKKIGELVESRTRLATYRRTNGKTYCLLPSANIGFFYSQSHGYIPTILPKRQIEVEVVQKDGASEAFIIGSVEKIDPEEEVEVLWDGEPKPNITTPDWDIDIPY